MHQDPRSTDEGVGRPRATRATAPGASPIARAAVIARARSIARAGTIARAMTIVAAAAVLQFVGLGFPCAAHADRVTGFDSGLEGWRITGDNESAWQATGGNPGGCFDVNDLAIGGNNLAVAPPAYLGDWSSLTPADSLLVDFYFQNPSGNPISLGAYTFRISGPGGAAHAAQGYLPPQGAWTTKGVPLDPAAWVIESGTWDSILAQVTGLLIEAEFVSGEEEVQLDNVRLTGDPVPVLNPCEGDTFAEAGLGDWSFQDTGGVSNPGLGGNGGGFCQVLDAAATSYAFAPSRYLGDWSSFEGTGSVSIDIRLVSRSGPVVGAAEFIRLSGPGGTASVALAPADIPLGGLVWKTLGYPISAATWTVTSGTWAGLLANVTECRIQVEWVSGSETIGFDNFARRGAGCPALDDAVVTHVADVTRCGYLSHVGVAGIALNPADGELYGTLDRTTANGGGLYRVTGDSAGIRLQAYAGATGIVCDAAGDVFVSDDSAGLIYRRTPAGASATWVSGLHTGDDDPSGMCVAPPGFTGPSVVPGNILVTDWGFSGPDEIWAFSPSVAEGELLVMPDPGERDIKDLATGPDGVVYAADVLDSTRIYRLTPTGTLVAIPVSQPVREMSSIVYDSVAGDIYVAATRDRTIRRIDPATGAVELVASGFAPFAQDCLELDAANRKLWLADSTASRVYEFCLVTGATSVEGGAPGAAGGAGSTAGSAAALDGTVSAVTLSPNPARAGTTVRFALAHDAWTTIEVFDVGGRLVRRLAGTVLAAGTRAVSWDGRDASGRAVADGIYMVRVRAGDEARVGRVIVAK